MIERRYEPRVEVDIGLEVWSIHTKEDKFLQQARARDVSLNGALLSGLDTDLRFGDLIGVLYAGRKARFRVIWVRHSGSDHKIQAAIHRVEGDACPWQELLPKERRGAAGAN
jgi:hypothetical protein